MWFCLSFSISVNVTVLILIRWLFDSVLRIKKSLALQFKGAHCRKKNQLPFTSFRKGIRAIGYSILLQWPILMPLITGHNNQMISSRCLIFVSCAAVAEKQCHSLLKHLPGTNGPFLAQSCGISLLIHLMESYIWLR